jgi:hypothetical protein
MTVRDNKFLAKLQDILGKGSISHEREIIAKFSDTSFDLLDIAAAAIKMARSNEAVLPNDEIKTPASDYRIISQPGNKTKNFQEKFEFKYKARKAVNKDKYQKKTDEASLPWNKTGKNEPGMIRLRMNIGNVQGIRPGDIVGAIAGEVGIPGRAIGEISIQKDHTFVDVAEKHIRQVLRQSTGQYSLRGKPVILTLAQ